MGKRIFVRNLSFGSTDEALRAHFENAGHQVRSARIVLDRETGKSRGFGFVELMSDERFDEAISSLDGSFLDGRPISVREAHDQRQGGGPPRRGPGGPGRPDRPEGAFPPRREGGGRDFGPPRREGGFGGPPRGEPGGFGGGPGFMPPDQQPTERRRPPQKKKKVYRADEDDRSSMREAEERRGRKQRRRMRGGFDGGFDDEW